MIFSSLTFLFAYLPITLALYFLVPLRWRNLVLLVVSLFFYGWGEPVYILIMILSILIDYSHGLLVEKYRADDRKARWFVGQSVVLNLLLLLGFFKYWDFLADNLFLLTGLVLPESLSVFGYTIPLRGIPLPIGISFFTFQTMSYTIDVYRQDAPVQRSMVKFGAFVTMFPQLIAGPIVQYKTVAAELDSPGEQYGGLCPGRQTVLCGPCQEGLAGQRHRRFVGGVSGRPGDRDADSSRRLDGPCGLWLPDLFRLLGLFRYGDRPGAHLRLPLPGELSIIPTCLPL